MTRRIVFLFPGQGAQYVGMGSDWHCPEVLATFEEASDILGMDIKKLCFQGPAEQLTETKNSQVAIFTMSVALLRSLRKRFPDLQPMVAAGLSLGEYSALVAAGKLPFAEALRLVQMRGLFMQQACEEQPGSMKVVLGIEEEAVQRALDQLNGQVWIANLNCPGQVVIAGRKDALEQAAAPLQAQGARRVLPLDVSGAFHTPLMATAREKLREAIARAPFVRSDVWLVMNTPGSFVDDPEEIRSFLVQQVTQPVRWEKGIRLLEKEEVQLYLEIGPGKTLNGMNRKIGVMAPTLSIDKMADLVELEQFLSDGHLCSC